MQTQREGPWRGRQWSPAGRSVGRRTECEKKHMEDAVVLWKTCVEDLFGEGPPCGLEGARAARGWRLAGSGRVATRHSPRLYEPGGWDDHGRVRRKLLASRETRDALRRVGEGSRTGKGGEKAQVARGPGSSGGEFAYAMAFAIHIAIAKPSSRCACSAQSHSQQARTRDSGGPQRPRVRTWTWRVTGY